MVEKPRERSTRWYYNMTDEQKECKKKGEGRNCIIYGIFASFAANEGSYFFLVPSFFYRENKLYVLNAL